MDWHAAPGGDERLAGAEDRGLDFEDVLRCFDQQQVNAAFEQSARLLFEDRHQFAEADRSERWIIGGGELAGRADRAGDEAIFADGGAGDLTGAAVDLQCVLGEAPLFELQAAGLEGVGLDNLCAGFDHRSVNAFDYVGAV